MQIRPFLANHSFDPETIEEMARALQSTCDALQLRKLDDAATESVAEKIIELVQRGVRGVEKLTSFAVQELAGRTRP